jgi:hypothetical protein
MGVIFPYGHVLASPTPGNQRSYACYVVASLLLYVVLGATLVVRRSLVTKMQTGVATLFQQGRAHSLSITGTVLGSSKRRAHAYMILDEVHFPLRGCLKSASQGEG